MSGLDAPDTAHSLIVDDHPFEPKDTNRYLCGWPNCNLAEAAHTRTLNNDGAGYQPPSSSRRIEYKHPEPDPRPEPLPVAEIDVSEAQEHMVSPTTLEDACFRCGTTDGVRTIPENGARLCGVCEQILKP